MDQSHGIADSAVHRERESARGAKQLFNGNWKLDAKPDELQWTQIRESILPILAEYGYTRVAMDLPRR